MADFLRRYWFWLLLGALVALVTFTSTYIALGRTCYTYCCARDFNGECIRWCTQCYD